MQVIKIKPERCKLCYACIRVCPSNAIQIKDNAAEIIPDRCIGCGSCLSVCPYYAIKDLDSKKEVSALIRSGEKVAAICAPSISGEFNDITNYTNFVGMIKALGFKHVCEVSFGADLVALKYRELFENFKGKYFITANCPAMVSYVERYHPTLIDNMAPLISPMVATAQVVREKYGQDVKVVYIGPCTAAKGEGHRYEGSKRVDIVLTFKELRDMFADAGITENNVEFSEFDPPIGGKGSLFPISRGMFQSVGINEDLMSGQLICADGKTNVMRALKEFENFSQLKQHLDLFYCDGNCIMGPGTSRGGQKFVRRSLVIAYTKKRLLDWNKEQWEKDIQTYLKLDYSRLYQNRDMRLPQPTDDQISEVMLQLGRDGSDKQTSCGACGYDSCRDLAVAVCNGLARIDLCHTYVVQSKNKYKRRLKAANEKLDNTQKALIDSEQMTRREQESFQEASKITTGLLNKLPTGVVIVDEKVKIIQSNQSFINLLGPDALEIAEIVPGLIGADLKTMVAPYIYNYFSYVLETNVSIQNKDIHLGDSLLNISVFPIKTNKIVGAIIRDMYVPEVRKEEVVSRINEVIDKNLKLIQEIAFLLGEGASDTEQMLNSIIESYKDRKTDSPQP
jgi:iron only hydrogenase large subunit-like protein